MNLSPQYDLKYAELSTTRGINAQFHKIMSIPMMKKLQMLKEVLLHLQITALLWLVCPPESATSTVTRDSLSCSLVLRPQANPRGALLLTSGDKYIVPGCIISA